MSEAVLLDGLTYELRRSPRRRTVGITIDRGGELILRAPSGVPLERVREEAREKSGWVYRKLAERDLVFRPRAAKEFVTGEGLWYLGKSYRLLLIAGNGRAAPPLRLHEGRFVLRRDELPRAQDHLVKWYIRQGEPWIRHRVELWAMRIGVRPRSVTVRGLGFRWGSCGRRGDLSFHWQMIQLPPRIIEYIVVHELVHLLEPRHGPDFWKRLERAMPDFATRKQWLAESGGCFRGPSSEPSGSIRTRTRTGYS